MIHGGDIFRNQIAIDFSVNTNPFGMPEGVKTALRQAVGKSSHYPDMQAEKLTRALTDKLSVPPQQLVVGNGASELIMAVMHSLKPKKILLPVPSFFGYERAAIAADSRIEYYYLKEEHMFEFREDFFTHLTDEIDLLFLTNPNNPTGVLLEPEFLEKVCNVCREKDIKVFLDECFLTLTQKAESHSFIQKVNQFPNVMVLRAFTKSYSMAGVRLGYLVSEETIAEKIRKQLPEWNLSIFAQEAGTAALKEDSFLHQTVDYLQKERREFGKKLREEGIKVYDSEANFLLIKSEEPLYEILLEQGILIRDCSNFTGLGQGYYRIAVKTREENEKLIAALKELQTEEDISLLKQKTLQVEYMLPAEIEERSFAIIGEELKEQGIVLLKWQEPVTKRVIHTSADFSYAHTMTYSHQAVETAKQLILQGADIVTDTNMALSGINKKVLARYGGEVHCFMADAETAQLAKERQTTRAAVSMERASSIRKPVIFAVGNAPTALLALYDMWREKRYQPAFIIGVPVGFVNVEAAKELILQTDIPYIINRGRKGGSNIAAAICNAILYELV